MRFTGLSEFFWYLLLFGGLVLFNLLLQRRRRRAAERRLRQAAQELPPQEAPPEASWGRGAHPVPPPATPDAAWGRPAVEEILPRSVPTPGRATSPSATRPAPPRPAVRTRTPAPRFRSREDLRHAIVALTVLGPCRARQPYGAEPSRPGRSE
jgi:hypothetical protein